MSSTTMMSDRQILAMVRATELSALALPMVMARVSRVNQDTRRLASMASWQRAYMKWVLPVPEGPEITQFLAVAGALQGGQRVLDGCGTEDSSLCQESKVLPLGRLACLQRLCGWRCRSRRLPRRAGHAPLRRARAAWRPFSRALRVA